MQTSRVLCGVVGLGLSALVTAGCARRPAPEPQAELTAPAQAEEPNAAPQVQSTPVAAESAPVAKATKMEFVAYEKAMDKARAANKPIMLDFYTDWCGVCKMMKSEVFTKAPILEESQNFVNVRINAEKRADLARTFGVDGYPTFIWLDTNGNIIDRLDGGMRADGFLERMKAARSKFSPSVKL